MLEQRVIDRFWSKVDKRGPDECWPWLGARLPRGYGTFGMRRGEQFYAHRVSFEIHNGFIDPSLMALHRCDNPPCCNGAHLFQGTHSDNMKDMWAKGRGVTPFSSLEHRMKPGEYHPSAKLNAESVRMIRSLRSEGLKLDEIAAIIGVGKSTVSRVINQEAVGGWGHV